MNAHVSGRRVPPASLLGLVVAIASLALIVAGCAQAPAAGSTTSLLDQQALNDTAMPEADGDPVVNNPPVNDPVVNNPPVNNPPVNNPPVNNPPVNDPPVNDPPVNDPPVNDPPVNNPPVNDPPVNDPPVNNPPVNDPPPSNESPTLWISREGSGDLTEGDNLVFELLLVGDLRVNPVPAVVTLLEQRNQGPVLAGAVLSLEYNGKYSVSKTVTVDASRSTNTVTFQTVDDTYDDIPAGSTHTIFAFVRPDSADPPRYRAAGSFEQFITETE